MRSFASILLGAAALTASLGVSGAALAQPQPKAGTPGCLKKSPQEYAERHAYIDEVLGSGGVRFCIGEGGEPPWEQCLIYKTAEKKYEFADKPTRRLPPLPPEGQPADTRLKLKGRTVEVCLTPESCKAVSPKFPKDATDDLQPWQVALNPAGTTLAVVISSELQEEQSLQLFDAKTGKAGAKAKVGDGSYKCLRVKWEGEVLVMDGNVCAGPGGATWIMNPKTAKAVGEIKDINTYSSQRVQLKDHVWAFLDTFGTDVVIADLRTGKTLKKINLDEVGGGQSTEGLSDLDALDPEHVVVVFGEPSVGKIAILDAKAGKVVASDTLKPCTP